MRPTAPRLIGGGVLSVLTLLGIFALLAIYDRLTGPTSQELIDRLVTTNPRTTGDWAEKRPVTWDDAEDARVHRIIAQLYADPQRHMDALIANVERTDFCTAMSTSVPFSPLSIGMICREVIVSHFYQHCPRSVYESAPDSKHGSYGYYFGAMKKAQLTTWWAENREKSNREIGRMIADWHRAKQVAKQRRK